jgi:predicted amidophosphoribosyltransferase
LVDDVLTTGATLSAAAGALWEGGWSEIGAVTFARALPYSAKAVAA